MSLSPNDMFERGVAQAGVLRLPTTDDTYMEFLEVRWRTIHHYGVDIDSRRYDGLSLNPHRNERSPHRGKYPGKWPIYVDRDDIRQVYFKDPADGTWHRLEWEHSHMLNAPFSAEAAEYTKRISLRENRFADPQSAVQDLIRDWSNQAVTERRDRNLARRLSAARATAESDQPRESIESARDTASVPGVIDLIERAKNKKTEVIALRGDLDVFEEYADFDSDEFGVFDE